MMRGQKRGGGGRGQGGGSGQGGGRGRGQGGGQGFGGGRGGGACVNSGGQCVCPACGATVAHEPGVPCSAKQCPQYGAVMMRQ